MGSQEDTFGPEAQRAVQGAQGGVQGVGVNPWGFGYGSGLTKFGAKGGGRGLQRIQQLVANAWAGARGGQSGSNSMLGGANSILGEANTMLGGANSMAAEEPEFMQGMTGTDNNAAARGNTAINLLAGLVSAQQGLSGATNIITLDGATTGGHYGPNNGGGPRGGPRAGAVQQNIPSNTVNAALQWAIDQSNEDGQRFKRELRRQEQLGEAKKEEFKDEIVTQRRFIKTFAVVQGSTPVIKVIHCVSKFADAEGLEDILGRIIGFHGDLSKYGPPSALLLPKINVWAWAKMAKVVNDPLWCGKRFYNRMAMPKSSRTRRRGTRRSTCLTCFRFQPWWQSL
jgi:hypothetical protein